MSERRAPRGVAPRHPRKEKNLTFNGTECFAKGTVLPTGRTAGGTYTPGGFGTGPIRVLSQGDHFGPIGASRPGWGHWICEGVVPRTGRKGRGAGQDFGGGGGAFKTYAVKPQFHVPSRAPEQPFLFTVLKLAQFHGDGGGWGGFGPADHSRGPAGSRPTPEERMGSERGSGRNSSPTRPGAGGQNGFFQRITSCETRRLLSARGRTAGAVEHGDAEKSAGHPANGAGREPGAATFPPPNDWPWKADPGRRAIGGARARAHRRGAERRIFPIRTGFAVPGDRIAPRQATHAHPDSLLARNPRHPTLGRYSKMGKNSHGPLGQSPSFGNPGRKARRIVFVHWFLGGHVERSGQWRQNEWGGG